jgi:hypothetical protein
LGSALPLAAATKTRQLSLCRRVSVSTLFEGLACKLFEGLPGTATGAL